MVHKQMSRLSEKATLDYSLFLIWFKCMHFNLRDYNSFCILEKFFLSQSDNQTIKLNTRKKSKKMNSNFCFMKYNL